MIDFELGVKLRTIEVEDLSWIRKWRNHPDIWRWTRQNDLLSESSHCTWFDRQATDPSIEMYMMVSAQLCEPIGVCGLTSIDRRNQNAEFSLYIGPEHHGQGLGILGLKTLFYHGFKNMGLRSIWGETFENNPARKMFTEVGMKEDGRRREFYWKDGRYWDAIMISVLSTEFISKHGDRSCF